MPPANAPSLRKKPLCRLYRDNEYESRVPALFNGKDLTGWKTDPKQPGNWHVENGVLIGSGPSISHLYTERDDFTDFHLRVEARFNKGGSSGVYFRCPFGPSLPADDPKWPDGFEATINNARIVRNITGGLYPGVGRRCVYSPVDKVTRVPFGQWFTLEVIADGDALAVLVNGKSSGYHVDRRQDSLFQRPHRLATVQPRDADRVPQDRDQGTEPLEPERSEGDRHFPDTMGRVNRVAFSPDGLRILSGGNSIES